MSIMVITLIIKIMNTITKWSRSLFTINLTITIMIIVIKIFINMMIMVITIFITIMIMVVKIFINLILSEDGRGTPGNDGEVKADPMKQVDCRLLKQFYHYEHGGIGNDGHVGDFLHHGHHRRDREGQMP